ASTPTLGAGKAGGTRGKANAPRGTSALPCTEIQLPGDSRKAIFRWLYAEPEDFNYAVRCNKVRQRLNDAAERGKCIVISHGPPLEVQPGVFVLVEPHPLA